MAAKKVLLVAAPFYEDITEELLKGARAELDAQGVAHETFEVPGAFEIPGVIAQAEAGKAGFDGYVALGCVIRGETTHYEIVSGESARALMDLSAADGLALGNGILTVENEAQAWARAKISEQNKGGGAAVAAMTMAALQALLMED